MLIIKTLAVASLASGACAAIAAIPTGVDSAVVVELPSVTRVDDIAAKSRTRTHSPKSGTTVGGPFPCIGGDPTEVPSRGCLQADASFTTALDHDAHRAEAAATTIVQTVVVTVVASPMVTVYATAPPEKRDTSNPNFTSEDTSTSTIYTHVKVDQTETRIVTSHSIVTASSSGTTTVYRPRTGSDIRARPPQVGTDFVTLLPDLPLQPVTTSGSLAIALTHTTAVAVVTASAGSLATLPPSRLTTLTNPINPDVTIVLDKSSPCCSTNTAVDTHSYIDIQTFTASGIWSYLSIASAASSSSGHWSSGSFYPSSTSTRVSALTTATPSTSSSSEDFPGAVTSNVVDNGAGKAVKLDDHSVLTCMATAMAACFAFALLL